MTHSVATAPISGSPVLNAGRYSCIVSQFGRYASLSETDIDLLQSLESNERNISARASIQAGGERTENFFTLKSGWAVAEQYLENGQRQVIDVFLPGQIIGLRDIAYQYSLCDFTSVTEAVICPFPKRRLAEIFVESPRLADLFFLMLAREQATLMERIVNLGRRTAIEKLAHFLLEMHERLGAVYDDMGDSYSLPMTQQRLGDTLGLSSVHVSRSFSRLSADGLIRRDGSRITLKDIPRLKNVAGFGAAYLDIDASMVRQ